MKTLKKIIGVVLTITISVASYGQTRLIISEFMAMNRSTYLDEEGTSSDWIEIYNPNPFEVNLDGWYLTDNTNNLTKWRFPSTNISAYSFMIVFASGKNKVIPGLPLHTSFNLAGEGEYLALVDPNLNVVSSFSPIYPPQYQDISYGIGRIVTHLPTTTPAKVFIPTDSSIDNQWMQKNFDDSAWRTGTNGIGFQRVTNGFAVKTMKANITVDTLDRAYEVLTNSARQSWVATGYYPYVNFFNTGGIGNYGNDLSFPGLTINTDVEDYVVEVRGIVNIPYAGEWSFGVNSDDGFIMKIGSFQMSYPAPRGPGDTIVTFNFPAPGQYPLWLLFYERGGGSELEIFAAPGRFSTWNSTNFRLVGDTVNGGLSVVTIPFESDSSDSYLLSIRSNVETDMLNRGVSAYIRIPFVVTNISSVESLFLRIKYDDGFVAYLNGVEIARRNAPLNPAWNTPATAIHNGVAQEIISIPEGISLLSDGTNILAIHGMNVNSGNTDFLIEAELVEFKLADSTYGYISPPTPGQMNIASYPDVAPKVQFSIPAGVYTNDVLYLDLSTPMSGAQIRFTLNGSNPTENSPIFTNGNPIRITQSVMVVAQATVPGFFPGPYTSSSYTMLDSTMTNFTSNLPILILSTYGYTITTDMPERAPATITTFDNIRPGARVSALQRPQFHGRAGVEGRGQTSWGFPKKPYNIELRDDNNQDKDAPLLGMPAESDWALINLYNDKSFMNDFLAHELFRQMGHYAVRARYVEVFLNGTDRPDGGVDPSWRVGTNDYVGLYLLIEKIKIDKNRVNISTPESGLPGDPITGGYIFKKDKASPGDVLFYTISGQDIRFHDPKPDQLTPIQQQWLKDYLNEFESVLYGSNWRDPVNGYSKYIDVDSFVDNHWIVEFSKQIDGYRLSNFMQKNRGGKIKMEPIWDWNLSFGNANYLEGEFTNGWYWPLISANQHIWLRRLIAEPGDSDFNQKLIDRWAELRKGPFATSNVWAKIDEIASYITEAVTRDTNRFPRMHTYIWPNPNAITNITFAGMVNYIKNFVANRANWIDKQFVPAPIFSRYSGTHNAPLTMTAPLGTIYYTLDGSDPRLPGGMISPNAIPYTGYFIPPPNSKIMARAFYTNQWSAPAKAVFGYQPPKIAVTELMYHPSPFPAGGFKDEEYEFIELTNTGNDPIDLTKMRLTGGVEFIFPTGPSEQIGQLTTNNFDDAGTLYTATTLASGPGAQVTSGEPSSNFLRLTHQNTGTNINRIAFDQTAQGFYDRFTAEFDFRGSNLTPPPPAGPATLQDFDTTPVNYVLTTGANAPTVMPPDSGSQGNFLRITPAVGNLNHGIYFDRTAPGTYSQVTITFDFRMNGAADGLGVVFMPTTLYGVSGISGAAFSEEPNLSGAIGVGFDIYNNNTPPSEPNANHVSLHWNGAWVATVTPALTLAANKFHRAQIIITFEPTRALVTVKISPDVYGAGGATETLFNNYPLNGVTSYEGRVAFRARTGGANATHDIDNVNVQYGVGAFPDSAGLSMVLLPTSLFGSNGIGSTLSTYTNLPEAPGLFAINFDMHSASNVNNATIHWNGKTVGSAYINPSILDFDSGQFHRANLTIEPFLDGSKVTLVVTPNYYSNPGQPITIFSNLVVSGYAPNNSRIEFAGRSGGMNIAIDIDNVMARYERFSPIWLNPGQSVLVVKNYQAFALRYGTNYFIAGEYVGYLDNNGERIALYGRFSEPIFEFRYNDKWYDITDGLGFSLVLRDPTLPSELWNSAENWRPSALPGGSPGAPDATPSQIVSVVINEVLAHSVSTVPPGMDVVEIYNPTTTPADISGWYLSDDFNDPYKYRFPKGTIIPAGGYLLVYETNFNANPGSPTSFALGADGDDIYIFSADQSGNLTGYYHGFDFGPSEMNVTFGRYITSDGDDTFVAQSTPTLGYANAGPKVGPIVISEIMYHPPDYPDGSDNIEDEYIELHNITDSPVPLYDPSAPTNTWEITGAVDYVFPQNVVVPPHGYVVLVSFDPVLDTELFNSFKAKYNLPGDVLVFGPYDGKLNNADERIEIKKPGRSSYEPNFRELVLVERVRYKGGSPWPLSADGLGHALHRINPTQFGNDVTNWTAAPPTPGRGYTPAQGAPVITASPSNIILYAGMDAVLNVSATGAEPLFYQWRYNGNLMRDQTNSTLVIPNIQVANAGIYQAVVYNNFGSASSIAATVTVYQAATILKHPETVAVLLRTNATTNATFTVQAIGNGPVSYQWQVNGIDIPGATNSSLTITNVQIKDDGYYRAIVTDGIASVPTLPARLIPMVSLTIIDRPTNLTVMAGQNASFYISVSGYPPPFGYQLRKGSTPLTPYIVTTSSNYTFTITNVQATDGGTYRIVVTNMASPAGVAGSATLTVLSPPVITNQPVSKTVDPGGSATFIVSAVGTAPLYYQWYRNNTPISGATSSSYNVVNAQLGVNDGAYYVVITNAYGATTSEVAMLIVRQPVFIVQHPTNLTVGVGGTAIFTVVPGGGEPYVFRWYYNLTNLISGATNATLVIPNVQVTNAGAYNVVVSNPMGSATSQVAILTVGRPPVITSQPQDVVAVEGTNVTFTVTATGDEPISYQWFFNGAPLAGQISPALALQNISVALEGSYFVVLQNQYGTITSRVARLTIARPPIITQQPTNITVAVGGNATFTVVAEGTQPLYYQWFFNATNQINNATNASYTITQAQMTNAGEYIVVVSNAYGVVTSDVAVLTVFTSDSDGDGMPDSWELANGLNPNDPSDANSDSDNDGMTNLQEFIAGTNPQDNTSVLKANISLTTDGKVNLSFTAMHDKAYSIIYSTNLGSGSWLTLTNIQSAQQIRTIQITIEQGQDKVKYYRLRVQ